jgi:hypothetical protein
VQGREGAVQVLDGARGAHVHLLKERPRVVRKPAQAIDKMFPECSLNVP